MKEKVILSLTSYKERLKFVPQVLKKVLGGKIKPLKIVLTLYKEDVQFIKSESPKLKQLIDSGCVELIVSDINIKSHLKYFYVMQIYREYPIITIDDDIDYDTSVIDTLFDTYNKRQNCVIANRVHKIKTDDYGNISPYKEWQIEYKKNKNSSDFLFATGVGGVMYPPNILEINESMLPDIYKCITADDVFLKYIEAKKNIQVCWSGYNKKSFMPLYGSQKKTLSSKNVADGLNDIYLKKYPPMIKNEKKEVKICVVHYNTPLLMDALIKSVKRFTPNSHIYVFDNSDKSPFINTYDNVTLFDNTQGQYIDFEKWLSECGVKNTKWCNNCISAKHCCSIQKCIELIDDNFILMDSDILLKRDVSPICDDSYCAVAETHSNFSVSFSAQMSKRVLPFLCYINVKRCNKLGINFLDIKRLHGISEKNTEYFYYDTGASFYYDIKDLENGIKEIKISNYITHLASGSWFDKGSGKTKKTGSSDRIEKWLKANKKLYEYPRPKICVYTCITNGYDCITEPNYVTNGVDYICFTDDTSVSSNTWEIRPLPKDVDCLDVSFVKKQRCIKITPHKYLSDYDVSVWVDGNFELNGDVIKFINEIKKDGKSVYIPKHPQRNCIYDEGVAVVKLKKDTKENVDKQLNEYLSEGYPSENGLNETNLIVRYHNDTKCIKLMETWWNEVKEKSHRDQLSFNYALWKTGFENILEGIESIRNSKYFKWRVNHRAYSNPNNYNLLKNAPKFKMNANPLDMPRMVSKTALFDRANFIQKQNNSNRRVQSNLLIGKHITMPNRSFAKPKKSAFNPLW